MLTYGPTGRSRGTATIVFAKPGSAAQAAHELNGVKVDNRAMKVCIPMRLNLRSLLTSSRSRLSSVPRAFLLLQLRRASATALRKYIALRLQPLASLLTPFTASPRPPPRRRPRVPPRDRRVLPTVPLVLLRQVPTRRRLVVLASPRPRLPKSSMLRCRTTSAVTRPTALPPLLLPRLPRPPTTTPTWTRSLRWSTETGCA